MAYISLTFLFSGVDLSTPRILKLPTFKAGYKVSSIQEKIRRIIPQPRKKHKNLGNDIRRGHIEEPQILASRWLYLCQGMLRNSNRRRPSIHIFHTVIFAFISKHLKTKFCRFITAWNFPIVTGLYFNFTNFNRKKLEVNFYLCL